MFCAETSFEVRGETMEPWELRPTAVLLILMEFTEAHLVRRHRGPVLRRERMGTTQQLLY